MDILTAAAAPVAQAPTLIPLFAALAGAVIGGAIALIGGFLQRAQDRRNAYADKVAEVATECFRKQLVQDEVQRMYDDARKEHLDLVAKVDDVEKALATASTEDKPQVLARLDRISQESQKQLAFMDAKNDKVMDYDKMSYLTMFMVQLYLPANLVVKYREMDKTRTTESRSAFTVEARITVEKARLGWLARKSYKGPS